LSITVLHAIRVSGGGSNITPHVPVVAEDHADRILATLKAINWARKQGHAPLVARVRHLNDKKKPDHWRAG
jgi:hypothetical protein